MEFSIVDLRIPTRPKMCVPLKGYTSIMSDNVQDSIRNTGIWGKEETSILVDILSKNGESTIIDVGSNSGYFSVIGLSYGSNVIAIEANPVYQQYVNKSIELNNFDKSKFKYYECFASNNPEPVLFDGWSGYDNMISKDNVASVSTVSIDNIHKKEVLLLKIDVEGAEPFVLKSAESLIKKNKIKYIMFELTYIIKNVLIREQIDILPYLKFSGFDLYEIVEKRLIPMTNLKNVVNNWVFEYNTNHVKHNPNLVNLSAGTNILAVLKGNSVPNVNLFL
jgi:FkbM family methyltransferase